MNLARKVGVSILISSLLLSTPLTVQEGYAAPVSKSVTTVQDLKTIRLTANSTIKISDLQFMYGTNEKTAYVTLTVANNGNTAIDFVDYWPELWTKSGVKYSLQMLNDEKQTNKIMPKTTKDFVFSAQINAKLNYSDLKARLIKWDFSMPAYTRNLGEISVPYSFDPTIPYKTGRVIKVNQKKLSTIVARSQFIQSGDNVDGSLVYRITNYSGQTTPLSNMKFYIKRPGGSLYNLTAEGIEGLVLQPGGQQEVQLTGRLPVKKIDQSLQLIVTNTDEASKVEMPVGVYHIKPETTVTNMNSAVQFSVDKVNLTATVRDAYYAVTGENQTVSVYVTYANKGKSTVSLPSPAYYIQTANGSNYNGQSEATAIELAPNMSKEVLVQFTVPSSLNTDGLKLLIRKVNEQKVEGFIIGVVQLPKQTEGQSSSGQAIKYNSQYGPFDISLTRSERLPWGDQDLLNAVITIRNPQDQMKTMPKLTAAMILNGFEVDKSNIQIVKRDNIVALEGRGMTQYYVSTKIPYTFTASDVSIQLYEERDSKDSLAPVGRFELKNLSAQPPTVKADQPHQINGIGRSASLQIIDSAVYTGAKTKMAYAEFDYTSLEKRFSNLANLQAYFVTKDGSYINANFQNVKPKVSPGKKALVMAYAEFPADYVTSDLKLIVGEGLTANGFTGSEETAESFVNAVIYEMPAANDQVQESFQGLKIHPYTINLKKMSPALEDATRVRFDFEYDVRKDNSYELLADKQKLVIELEDRSYKFEQSFELEDGNGALRVGDALNSTVTFEDYKLMGVIFRDYKINIYAEYKGHKRLLASQEMVAGRINF